MNWFDKETKTDKESGVEQVVMTYEELKQFSDEKFNELGFDRHCLNCGEKYTLLDCMSDIVGTSYETKCNNCGISRGYGYSYRHNYLFQYVILHNPNETDVEKRNVFVTEDFQKEIKEWEDKMDFIPSN